MKVIRWREWVRERGGRDGVGLEAEVAKGGCRFGRDEMGCRVEG